jgi:hypothetical protein
MDATNEAKEEQLPFAIQGLLVFGGICSLAFLMYYTYTYPSVSGAPVSLWSFNAFWLREFLLLGFFAIAIVWAAVCRLVVVMRRAFRG